MSELSERNRGLSEGAVIQWPGDHWGIYRDGGSHGGGRVASVSEVRCELVVTPGGWHVAWRSSAAGQRER